jgi:lipopolysaccharide transport system ATP-binding protein
VEPAISFQDVYKEYPFYQHIVSAGFKSFLFNLPKNIASLKKTRFMALNGTSFDVGKGETFGIMGKNGSGKSTLLGIMAGVIRADGGTVKTCGKISSLLELGAGFHPDLSGVENIILNGILMGNTKEAVVAKMDRIIEFSELGDFIYQPLRTYSSGMQMRLGFSVAVHIDPEILLIDEALAVGDMNFQEKCQKKMKEFRESGATIVIVSHDMQAIAKLCDRAMWIDGGKVLEIGEPKKVIMKYLATVGQQMSFSGDVEADEVNEEGVETQAVETQAAETQAVETQAVETQAVETQAVETQAAETQAVETQAVETQAVETQAAETQAVETQATSAVDEEAQDEGEGVAAPGSEARSLPPHSSLSWWDSPAIIGECVSQITGRPEDSFYEFLARQYMIGSLEKGLSFCCRLEGIETNFMISKICKSFDVVDDERTVERIASGSWRGSGPYDFLLCIDFLHRFENPDAVLGTIAAVLKEKAVIVAIEYVGPAGYARSTKEMKIADAVFALLRAEPRREYAPSGGRPPLGSRRLSEGAKNPGAVLPAIRKRFDNVDIRYFGGPLLDMVVGRILERDIAEDEADSPEMQSVKSVIRLEKVLIREKVLGSRYAMVVAEKKSPGTTVH